MRPGWSLNLTRHGVRVGSNAPWYATTDGRPQNEAFPPGYLRPRAKKSNV